MSPAGVSFLHFFMHTEKVGWSQHRLVGDASGDPRREKIYMLALMEKGLNRMGIFTPFASAGMTYYSETESTMYTAH